MRVPWKTEETKLHVTFDEENNDKLSEESDDLVVTEKKNRVAKSKNLVTTTIDNLFPILLLDVDDELEGMA